MFSRPLRVWCILLSVAVSGSCTSSDAAQSVAAPRTAPLALTPTEYNNTIADLLGFPRDGERWPARPVVADTLSPRRAASKGVFLPPPPPPVWPWRFPSEPGANGFEGIAQGQNPSSYQVEELHLAAMHFASFALVSPTFFTCADWATLPATDQDQLEETAPGLEALQARFRDNDSIKELLVSIASSDLFRTRPTTDPGDIP